MRDLRDVFVIARREFLERVRSKWFIGMTLLGPIGIVALVLIPVLLTTRGEGSKVEILDHTGVIARPLARALEDAQWKPAIVDPSTPDDVEMRRIRDKQINGFLAIPRDALDNGQIVYRGDNGSSQIVGYVLGDSLRRVVQSERGKRAGIPPDKIEEVVKRLNFDPRQTNGTTEGASGVAQFWLGYGVAYMLLLVIMIYAVAVMRSVVQEKTSRVMELMVATVKPRSLMAGKILGVGAAGLVQFGIWLLMGALTLAYRDQVIGLFGRAGGGSGLPSLAFDQVVIALVFFLLGYFFYASMYAAVGAMVSSEQDTQQVQMPIMIVLLLGFAFVPEVSGDPRGSTAVILTMVPVWSSLLMPLRYLLGGATLGEVAISLGILVVSTVVVARAAAKIYRVGVLMYGKRPGLQELIRWLRY
jgi:ABC-2 type transport system permease protein